MIVIDERGRTKLGNVLLGVTFLLICVGFMFVVISIYISSEITFFKVFLGDYQAARLVQMLGSIGGLMMVICTAGGKLIHACLNPKKRRRYHTFMILYMFCLFILMWAELSVSIMCLVEKEKIRVAFKMGIKSTLEKYRHGAEMKKDVDDMQLEFKCCGESGYRDWFTVKWMHRKYVGVDSPRTKRYVAIGLVSLVFF